MSVGEEAGAPTDAPDAPRPVGVATSTPYLPELEGLRGVAIALVVAFHVDGILLGPAQTEARGAVGSPLMAYVRAGFTGVNLFFVLSAFLLTLPFLAEAAGGRPVSVRRYFARRALRILPLYWLVVLAIIAWYAQRPSDMTRALPYMLFLHVAPGTATVLGRSTIVWWSLATEVQFYLLLPLLPLLLRSRRGRLVGWLALGGYALSYWAFVTGRTPAVINRYQGAVGASLLGRLPLFICGGLAAWLFLRHGNAIRARLARSYWACRGGGDAVMLLVLLALGLLLRWATRLGHACEFARYHYWHVLEGGLWTVVLLLVLLAPLRVRGIVCSRALIGLGVVSYSVYLLHIPVFETAIMTLARNGVVQIGAWTPIAAAAAALLCAATLGLSMLTYRFIEQPFLRRKERL